MNQKFDIERSINPEGLALIIAEKKITQCEDSIKNMSSQVDAI